tara:strand:+ start:380 stop:673 length:294 start_codon:yes stop_codon:yes gene_type:complete
MSAFDLAWELVKRDVRDPIHGSVPDRSAMIAVRGTQLRPLRRQGHTQRNERVIRNEGSPTSSKGDKNTDKPKAMKLVDNTLRRLKLVGERGDPKQKS